MVAQTSALVWLCLRLDVDADAREARLFFLLVTVVLAGVAITEVRGMPDLRAPARMIPFALLMTLHIALYWFSPRFADTLRRTLVYLAVQTVLVFVITQFPRDFSIVVGLHSSLLGIAVGMVREKRRVALAVVIWLVLATFNLVLVLGYSAISTWVMFAPPLTFFVVIYVVLYGRQVAARDHAQSLLRELEAAHHELAEYADPRRRPDAGCRTPADGARTARHIGAGRGGIDLAVGSRGFASRRWACGAGAGDCAAGDGACSCDVGGSPAGHRRFARTVCCVRLDLASALRDEVERFTNATGIPCALDLQLPDSLPDASMRARGARRG